jgi:Starch-binding associating with outer membrane
MKKIIIIAILPLLMLAACKKNITDLNVDPKNPQQVPSYSLFTSAQSTLANTLVNSSVNINIFRLIVQHWTETTYTDESNYDLATRSIPRSVWNSLYRDVLRDFEEAKRLIPTDVADAGVQKNQIAIAEVMEIYTWHYLVTTFGNIPYSEALNIDNAFPKYDDAATIYASLLTRLDGAIGSLSTASASFGDADIIYGGNITAWKKFANSIKLKMAMTIADSDPAKAKSAAEAAAAGAFTSNSDNALFGFLASPPNTNPVWVDLVQSGRKDYVVTTTIVNKLKALNDPRVPLYFTEDAGGGYSGGIPGASNNYAAFSKPSDAITSPDYPGDLLDYAEIEFLLAEAVERGFSVGGTAASHYNKAVTASITYWGGTVAQANTYLAQPAVAYATATGAYKQKIGEQKWIANYEKGWDAWVDWRRLDFPALAPAAQALSVIPLRFTYNVDEQNLNKANYSAAAAAIGTDKVSTKLWFDKF